MALHPAQSHLKILKNTGSETLTPLTRGLGGKGLIKFCLKGLQVFLSLEALQADSSQYWWSRRRGGREEEGEM